MILGSVIDSDINEKRIAISPDTIKKYINNDSFCSVRKRFWKELKY